MAYDDRDNEVMQHYTCLETLFKVADHLRGFTVAIDEDRIEDIVIESDGDEWDVTIYYRK